MERIVLANVPHYYYLAHALFRDGSLGRYITTVSLVDGAQPPRWLPWYWRRKLEGRRLVGLPVERISQLWPPELLQRSLPQFGVSNDLANWVNNYLFDLLAFPMVSRCEQLHFVNGVGLFSARKARRLGATIICDVREAHPSFQESILRREYAKLGLPGSPGRPSYYSRVIRELKLADFLVVPSTFVRDTFIQYGFDESNIVTVNYGVDLDQFPFCGADYDGFTVIYVGRITPGKGIQYLLETATDMALRPGQIVLVGPIDPAMRPVLKRFEGRFQHVPPVPKAELHRYYSSATVFVSPSLVDAFSLSVLEAMACGLPVIISTNVGARDVVREGVDGFVVPVADVDNLRDRLQRLQHSPQLRRAMGHAAAERAREMTWMRYEDTIIDAYHGRLGGVHRDADGAFRNLAV